MSATKTRQTNKKYILRYSVTLDGPISPDDKSRQTTTTVTSNAMTSLTKAPRQGTPPATKTMIAAMTPPTIIAAPDKAPNDSL
mmetsp:Transcript_122591/g.183354  ORF Transcript_122591/g.183354 Transcript_122591/m.183354 type:complete len:83 (+) Transcript_122591:1454-1702(+)